MKKNILYIFPDQMGARWLPTYGNPIVKTPNIEEFAKTSVVFDHAYTNLPLCTPYRACLFTGKYASETGVDHNGMCLPTGQQTLAGRLNNNGYATHYVGKWHLSGHPQANRWVPFDQRGDFQNFIGWESHHVDHYKGLIWKDNPDESIELKGHETDGLTDIVCEELDKLKDSNREKPFFMTVAYQAPHPPSTPPKEFYDMYDKKVLDYPETTDKDAWYDMPGWKANYSVEEFRKRYFGEISHFDTAFGRIIENLKANGLYDDTIIILTSDHGEMAGAHELFSKKVMHEESTRVPFIIRVPENEHNGRQKTLISTVDIFATILELADIELPSDCSGKSFAAALSDLEFDMDKPVFIENNTENKLLDALVYKGYKLVTKRNKNEAYQLYNLEKDPFEKNNLADKELDIQKELITRLNKIRENARIQNNCSHN